MKSLLFKLFVTLLFCSVTIPLSAQFSGSGKGTKMDPFRIYNAEQLNQVRNFLNKEDVYFSLEADINMTDWLAENSPVSGWQPIGDSSSVAFMGTFNGNGHTISNLWINCFNTNVEGGLFGYVNGGNISNLTLEGIDYSGGGSFGGIIYYCIDSSLTNLNVTNANITTTEEGTVGGIVNACRSSSLTNLNVTNANITGAKYVTGGIVGYIYEYKTPTVVSYCSFSGKISGCDYVGGIAGGIWDSLEYSCPSEISNCRTDCIIEASGSGLGGIAGMAINGCNIIKCQTVCKVIGGVKNGSVGGIVGSVSCTVREVVEKILVENNYSHLTVLDGYNGIGGVIGTIGYCHNSLLICVNNNYSTGSINGNTKIGGLIGSNIDSFWEETNDDEVHNCNYAQYQKITGNNNVAGLYGYVVGPMENSVAINNIIEAKSGEDLKRIQNGDSGSNNLAWALTTMIVNGEKLSIPADDIENGTSTGLSTLKLQATYEGLGWDFTDTWKIEETESFPYFQWQTAPPYFSQTLKKGDTHLSGQCTEQGAVTVRIGDKRYSAQTAGNAWSVDLEEPLAADDMVEVWVQAEGKMPSYVVCSTVGLAGSGTEADPYLIASAEDLQTISDITEDNPYYRLTADIDLTDYIAENGWKPVSLRGHFDGQSHTVSGLQCDADMAGLLRTLAEGSEIKDLKVVIADNGAVKGSSLAGGLVASNKGTIVNCSVSGNVEGGTSAGGMAGENSGTVTDCSVNGSVSGTSVGGVAGKNSGVIMACSVDGNISGGHAVGGIAGENSGTILECYTAGRVSSQDACHIGGVVGENSDIGQISDCYSDAFVSLSSFFDNDYGGGIAGYNFGKIARCYACGDVSGRYVAGVCGYNDGYEAVLTGCVAANSQLSGKLNARRVLGGYTTTLPGRTDNYAWKGMKVLLDGVSKSIYDDSFNGTAKSKEELMKQATYETLGWNFTDVWKIDEGTSYPYQPRFAVYVSEITLDRTEAELQRGSSLQLVATVMPENARNKTVKWTSGDDKIATVDAGGVVTAIAIGSTTITATAADGSGVTAVCKVTVTPKLVTSITLSNEELTLEILATAQLTATALPEDADNRKVEWKSGNPEVATVSGDGLVTATGIGTTTITATATDGSETVATCKVTVTPKLVKSITLSDEELTIERTYTRQLTATALPEDADNREVEWSSDKTEIATVDENGLVTAVGTGTATITATAADGSGVTASCIVTVTPKLAESVSLDKKELSLERTATAQLTATVSPATADDQSVTWSSGDIAVARVDENGMVMAVGVGETTITATTDDGTDLTATCTVTVTPKLVKSLSLSETELSLENGSSGQLTAIISPQDADDVSVSWQTNNASAATVDATGRVTATGVGTAVITATTNDGTNLSATCTVTVTPKEVTHISFDKTTLTLKVNESSLITATVLPEDADDRRLIWSSGNNEVARVSSSGEVTAVGIGETEITATANDGSGVSAVCRVTVLPIMVTSIILDRESLELFDNSSFQLTATVLPYNATDRTVTWQSTNDRVASVDADGTIYVWGVGETDIIATANDGSGVSATCHLTVIPVMMESITLDKEYLEIQDGDRVKLTVTALEPYDVSDSSLTWTSSDENVATVYNGSSNGCYILAEGVGETDIIASANDGSGVSATCRVIVTPVKVSEILLGKTELVMVKGQSEKLIPTVWPDNASDKSLTWTSSDESVVMVDNDGNVEAVNAGEADVTATTNDGTNLTATCHVTVIDSDGGVYTIGADGISVLIKDGRIVVVGKDDDEIVTVHTLEGKLVYRGTDNAVDVYSNVFYLVTVRGTTYKVFIP